MLARIKSDLPGIQRALLELDDVTLTVDNLKAISKQLPTSDEVSPSDRLYLIQRLHLSQITRLKDFEDITKLAKADQYFSQVLIQCSPFLHMLDVCPYHADHEYSSSSGTP